MADLEKGKFSTVLCFAFVIMCMLLCFVYFAFYMLLHEVEQSNRLPWF